MKSSLTVKSFFSTTRNSYTRSTKHVISGINSDIQAINMLVSRKSASHAVSHQIDRGDRKNFNSRIYSQKFHFRTVKCRPTFCILSIFNDPIYILVVSILVINTEHNKNSAVLLRYLSKHLLGNWR